MTTTTLRPNGTILAAASVTGAANTHSATNDDSDSSYATVTVLAWVALETFMLPAGAVTKLMTAQARARAAGGGHIDLRVRTSSSPPVVHSFPAVVVSGSFGTVSTASKPVTLTQADIDGLEFGFSRAVVTSSADIAELYLVIVYVAQPAAAVTVTPDPFTASTIVPVSWVNTLDADGGEQTRYQVRVFTAAQYGAGGFDPATSEAFFDTGEVLSSATAADVGPLETGVTYRAYVRVAQTVNGVSHWSAWAFDQFTVDVDTADIASVTPVPSDATGAVTVTVTRDGTSEPWDFVEVQRSLDAGATWVDVRGATYVSAAGHATVFVVVDHEVPNGSEVRYRARATWLDAGLPITGSWTLSSPVSWTSPDTWLKVPGQPWLNTVVKLQEMPRLERPRRVGVHRVLGGGFPVVVSEERGAAEAQLTFWFRTSDDAADIAAALDEPVVLLVGPPDWHRWGSRYLAVGSEVEAWQEGAVLGLRARRGTIQVDVWEVAAPPDPTAGR